MRRRRSPERIRAAAQRNFDRRATRYEASNFLAQLQDAALAALGLGPDDVLLDVGCGVGRAVREAAPLVARAVGTDISGAMTDRAGELSKDIANAEFVQAPSDDLPFPDEVFTAVVCTAAFHHFPEPERSLGEIARILRPRGRLVIADFCRDPLTMRVFDRFIGVLDRGHAAARRTDEMRSMMGAAGLHVTAVDKRWHGHLMMIAAEKSTGTETPDRDRLL